MITLDALCYLRYSEQFCFFENENNKGGASICVES